MSGGIFPQSDILPIIIANTLIGIVQEIRAKRTLEKMSILNAPHAIVVRDGSQKQVASEELVEDDVIPAAGRRPDLRGCQCPIRRGHGQ